MTSESLFCARIALLQFVANELKHLLHVPVQSIPEIFLGLAPRLRSRILEIGGTTICWLFIASTTLYNYIIYLFCSVLVEGRRHHVGIGLLYIYLLSFQSW